MEIEAVREPVHVFGDCRLDLARGALARGDTDVRLRPQTFRVLEYLVLHAGRLVSRQDLLDAVWGRRAVTDDSVTQCIVEIRRALGPDLAGSLLTVPKRGFRFDVEVRVEDARPDAPADVPHQPHSVAPASRRRVRALPIVGLSALLLPVVTAWNDVRPEGTDRPAVGATPALPEAEQAYQLGQHYYHRRAAGDLALAERQLQRAVELDPTHARAWTALAGVYAALGWEEHGDGMHRLDEQIEALQQALRLDPQQGRAYVRLSRALWRKGDEAGANDLLQRALAVTPDDPLVLHARSTQAYSHGRTQEAVALLRRAVAIEPTSALHRLHLGHALLGQGLYAEGASELRQAQRLSPGLGIEERLAGGLVAARRYDDARSLLPRLREGSTRDQFSVLLDAADADAARTRLEARGDADSALRLAEIAAHRGSLDAAFGWLGVAQSRARAESPATVVDLAHLAWRSPLLEPLRRDPRWTWSVPSRLATAQVDHMLRR